MSTFPQPFLSSVSHWQATNRGPGSLYSHTNPSTGLPDSADIVIVGGGLQGAALAYFLSREGAAGHGKAIVVLEAKDVASGATGRNGGHIGPATSNSFVAHTTPFPFGCGLSEQEAVHVIQAERDNLNLAEAVIRHECLDVDFWRGDLCETHTSEAQSQAASKKYEAWLAARARAGLTDDSHGTRFVTDAQEAQKISRIKGAVSVQLRPAGSVHSHKLCTEIMKLALASQHSHVQLFTWTPVIGKPERSTNATRAWMIQTEQGSIQAGRLILCTNAHTRNFFPEDSLLYSHITPRLAQCSLITPTTSFSGEGALRHTYNTPDHYLVQTVSSGLVLGGGVDALEASGEMTPNETIGVVDDSETIKVLDKALAGYCSENFEGWGAEARGEGLTRSWTGILTYVLDYRPLVGPVPDSPGLFIAAGFHGHGMSKIWSVASALARMLALPEDQWAWDEKLPRSFELTSERLELARDGLRQAREKAGPAADRWVPNEGGPGFRASSME